MFLWRRSLFGNGCFVMVIMSDRFLFLGGFFGILILEPDDFRLSDVGGLLIALTSLAISFLFNINLVGKDRAPPLIKLCVKCDIL